MDQAIKEEHIPSGGIADFIYTDEELDILEQQELEADYGKSGIAQFKKVGKKIASYGRYGDDTVAHVEKGELIVPRALIEGNPELKESIFSHLKELGIEDPERYVVGTSKNSINPDTGLPEFFLKKLFKGIKRGVSSIGRGVKSAVKSVGKALKKAAPIIIPMALNFMFPGLGAVYSGALGAGIGTLVQGGSLQDAFKSALLGGATGAVTAGFAGEGGYANFGENVMADVRTGTSNISSAFQGDFKALTQPSGPSLRGLFKEDVTPTTTEGSPWEKYGLVKRPVSTIETGTPVGARGGLDASGKPFLPDYQAQLKGMTPPAPSTEPTSMFDRAGDWLFRGGKSKKAMLDIQNKARSDAIASALKSAKDAGLNVSSEAVQKAAFSAGEKAFANAGPGFLTKYGPSLGIAGLGLTAAGAFEAPEQERLSSPISGMDLFKQNPDLYRIANLTPRRATRKDETERERDFIYEPYKFKDPRVFYARQGGLAGGGLAQIRDTLNQGIMRGVMPLKDQIDPFLDQINEMATKKFGVSLRGSGFGETPFSNISIPAPSLGGIQLGSSGPATTVMTGLSPTSLQNDISPSYLPIDQGEGIDQFGKPMPTNEQTGPARTDEERLNMLKSAFGQGVSQSASGAFGGGNARQSGINNFITGIGTLGLEDGGTIFPRRTGGIAPNEGIPGQDSVRAMLMPGEFVMTTDAVKGLGNGNLNTGINNMYSVMRKLEHKGRAMA